VLSDSSNLICIVFLDMTPHDLVGGGQHFRALLVGSGSDCVISMVKTRRGGGFITCMDVRKWCKWFVLSVLTG